MGTIPERTLSVGETATVDVSSHFSDPDGDALSYTAVSSNTGLVTVTVAGSSVTVASVAQGVATVTVTARDPQGLLAQQRFQVTVPDRAPEVLSPIPSQTLHVGQTASVDASVHFRDPDGDPVTYSAVSANPEVATVSVSAATITIRATASGVATVTVRASDPGGGSARQAVLVTVLNRAPVAVGTISGRTLLVGETATVDVSSHFSDPDGDALSYSAGSSNTRVAQVSASGSAVSVVALAGGDVTVTVTATDPQGLAAQQRFAVTVTVPNRAPEAVGTIPARTLTVGQSETLDVAGNFQDQDGDALTYTAASSAAGVVTVSVSGSALTLSGVSTGTASVTVTVADPDGLTARLSFGVTVETVTTNGFQIELVFVTAVTETLKAVFARAAEHWMTILAPTELYDVRARTRDCGEDPRFVRFAAIDDLMILVVVEEMARPTLASAGPCWTRGRTGLPSYGYLRLNSAYIDEYERTGRLEGLVIHEMAHVLGLGTIIWEDLGLLKNPASGQTPPPDTHFSGPLAIAAFDDAGGTGYAGAKVPVENTGGPGSRNGHWRESVFGDELMTGWFYDRPKPLSMITIQSLADLGYAVDVTAAESYRLPAAASAAALEPARRIPYGDDVRRGPIVVEGPDGRIVRVIPARPDPPAEETAPPTRHPRPPGPDANRSRRLSRRGRRSSTRVRPAARRAGV